MQAKVSILVPRLGKLNAGRGNRLLGLFLCLYKAIIVGIKVKGVISEHWLLLENEIQLSQLQLLFRHKLEASQNESTTIIWQ